MTKLTTHVLDVYSGKPGKGIKVDLYYYVEANKKIKINSIILNNDGRAEKPLVEGPNFKKGKYEIVFFVGEYFKKSDKVSVKAGALGDRVLTAAEVRQLAKLPGLESLRAHFLSLLNTSASQLLSVMSAPARGFVTVLKAKADQN